MPPAELGVAATFGAEDFSAYMLQHLTQESVLLRAGCRRINITGTKAHIPRITGDGVASWTAEATEIDSDAPEGDEVILEPKKLANVDPRSARLILDVACEADARDLFAREQRCCAFFDFTVAVVEEALVLDVHVPTGSETALAFLLALALPPRCAPARAAAPLRGHAEP